MQIAEGLDLKNCQGCQKVRASQGGVQVGIVKPGGWVRASSVRRTRG